MYSTALCAIRRQTVEAHLTKALPQGLREFTPPEVQEYRFRMRDLFDKKGVRTRSLLPDEQRFILNEQILSKIDYRYFAERYSTCNLSGQTLGPLFPLWESQELILQKLGEIEWERYQSNYPDGVIANVLKARQLGASSLIESIVAHRIVTHSHTVGLIASDVPDNSNYLYDMFERVIDNLPWYMLPSTTERVKNDEMVFGTGSRLMMGASKSTRGADKSESGQGGKKGQIGRGKTPSIVHLSELATWTNPSQIDTSLEPGIPYSPMTFWVKESTAQGRGPHNWWYMDWQNAKSGKSRSAAIFIPWYIERSKYRLPYPTGWVPSGETLAHARRIEENSPRWTGGKVYRCSKEQLYWYERKRAEQTAKDQLEEFLQEYPADDEEAFQMSGKSVFGILIRERVKMQARPLSGLVEIKSNQELGLA